MDERKGDSHSHYGSDNDDDEEESHRPQRRSIKFDDDEEDEEERHHVEMEDRHHHDDDEEEDDDQDDEQKHTVDAAKPTPKAREAKPRSEAAIAALARAKSKMYLSLLAISSDRSLIECSRS